MRVLWLSLAIIIIDQITKVLIKGSEWLGIKGMHLGESRPVFGDWFKITFTENAGMAFGIEWVPKLFLTLFSVLATIGIVWYLYRVRKQHIGYRLSLAAIIAGAFGNIIDRVFYAKWYGYGDLFYGEVVDFIHFDIWRGNLPDWLPIWGGQWTALFPIWNVADMSIVVGVMAIMIFQGRFHKFALAQEAAEEQTKLAALAPAPEAVELGIAEPIQPIGIIESDEIEAAITPQSHHE